jgi:ketosteroid isomerase-like protein
MSQRNVDLLKGGFYDHWARGEYPSRPDLVAAGAQFSFSDEFPDLGSACDPVGRRKLLEDWLSAWIVWRVEAEEFVEEGNLVLVLNRVWGTGKGSDVEVETTGAHLWELRDGEVVAWTIYLDQGRARQEMARKLAERR